MTDEHAVDDWILRWRSFVTKREGIAAADVDELEDHLRDQIEGLQAAGLAPDEAFLVGVKRLGSVDALSREFAREHSERLWKQLVAGDEPGSRTRSTGLLLAIVLAAASAVAVKLPALLGVSPTDDPGFFIRNAALLVLPFLAVFFVVRRRPPVAAIAAIGAVFLLAAVLLNAYPFAPSGATRSLAALHAVVVLWLACGVAYAGGRWRSARARMDFVRFTGEWVVYVALIALGGGVLAAITIGVFQAIGLNATGFVDDWLLPCGAAGAVVVAAWLVEAKQAVIENMAPVLTRVFTPLFTALLLVLIVAGLLQGGLVATSGQFPAVFGQRDLLVIFDVVLIVVLGLLLYSFSARDPLAPPTWFERLQLVLLASAIVVDVLVLVAMLARIGAFGVSANKAASLGLNLILLVNLAWALWLQLRFVAGRVRFARLERWQTGYLPVYFAWAVIVVAVLPPAFGFV